MLAHYHGQTRNAAEPARALGVNESITHRHLDLMTDTFMIRQLQPFHANLRKRQVKAPKVYVRDSGLLHHSTAIDIKEESYRLKEKKKAGLLGTTPKTQETKEKK